MKTNMAISVLFGLLLGIMLFPMIMIPLMGGAVVVGAIYMVVHDVILPMFPHQHHTHSQH